MHCNVFKERNFMTKTRVTSMQRSRGHNYFSQVLAKLKFLMIIFKIFCKWSVFILQKKGGCLTPNNRILSYTSTLVLCLLIKKQRSALDLSVRTAGSTAKIRSPKDVIITATNSFFSDLYAVEWSIKISLFKVFVTREKKCVDDGVTKEVWVGLLGGFVPSLKMKQFGKFNNGFY